MQPLKEHWNEIFKKTDDDKLGWHENDFLETLKFLNLIPGWDSSKIFLPGVGTSGLIDILSKSGVTLVLNDLSPEAIEKAKNKCCYKTENNKWLCQDISEPLPSELNDIDIWIDRAVLHFLTDDSRIVGNHQKGTKNNQSGSLGDGERPKIQPHAKQTDPVFAQGVDKTFL